MDLYGQTWQPFHLKPSCRDFWTEALGGGTCFAEPWKESGDTTETSASMRWPSKPKAHGKQFIATDLPVNWDLENIGKATIDHFPWVPHGFSISISLNPRVSNIFCWTMGEAFRRRCLHRAQCDGLQCSCKHLWEGCRMGCEDGDVSCKVISYKASATRPGLVISF